MHTLATVFGLAALLAASAGAFTLIKLAGAAYLVFLGIRMIAATLRKHAELAESGGVAATGRVATATPTQRSARRIFAQGFLTNVLNPKVALFFLSFFPQFVSADSEAKPLAFLVLGATLIGISTLYNGGMAWVAGSITQRMRGAPRAKAWLERAVGAAFVALGGSLALPDR